MEGSRGPSGDSQTGTSGPSSVPRAAWEGQGQREGAQGQLHRAGRPAATTHSAPPSSTVRVQGLRLAPGRTGNRGRCWR